MASTKDISRETNTRFWIMSAYKPGTRLDPNDPADKRMARTWLDIYRELKRQDARGVLSLTHKHQTLAQRLNDAIAAYRIESATREDDPRHLEAQQAKAQALNEASMWQEMLAGQRIT